ncbi:MAG: hypothetical protein ABIH34_03320 [Nanoarchaeota archaeon]
MRKAQIETLGLAFIVVLIALGFLFIYQFTSSDEPDDTRGSFTQGQLANNLVSAMLVTQAEDCHGQSLRDLMIDCVDSNTLECGDGTTSCPYVRDAIDTILTKTLDTRTYIFNVSVAEKTVCWPHPPTEQEGCLLIKSDKECSGSRRLATYHLRTEYSATMDVELALCR